MLYEFDTVIVTQGGSLICARPNSITTDIATVTVAQLQGDGSGLISAVAYTNVSLSQAG